MFSLLRCFLLPSPSSLLASNFKTAFSLQRIFRCQIFPLRGFTAGCSCVFCSVTFAWEIAWDSPIVNIVSQTMNKQVRSSWILWSLMGNRFRSNVAQKPYDAMADTIGYIQVKMSVASLQLARIHARSTHFACDEIINSLRSALREEWSNFEQSRSLPRRTQYSQHRF